MGKGEGGMHTELMILNILEGWKENFVGTNATHMEVIPCLFIIQFNLPYSLHHGVSCMNVYTISFNISKFISLNIYIMEEEGFVLSLASF